MQWCSMTLSFIFLCCYGDTAGGIPTFGSFGEGTGPIFLSNVGCFGTERNLLECQSSGVAIITNCNHAQDVGVVCSSRFPFQLAACHKA